MTENNFLLDPFYWLANKDAIGEKAYSFFLPRLRTGSLLTNSMDLKGLYTRNMNFVLYV
jgi:hypothetical protein